MRCPATRPDQEFHLYPCHSLSSSSDYSPQQSDSTGRATSTKWDIHVQWCSWKDSLPWRVLHLHGGIHWWSNVASAKRLMRSWGKICIIRNTDLPAYQLFKFLIRLIIFLINTLFLYYIVTFHLHAIICLSYAKIWTNTFPRPMYLQKHEWTIFETS